MFSFDLKSSYIIKTLHKSTKLFWGFHSGRLHDSINKILSVFTVLPFGLSPARYVSTRF